jgi:transposase
MEVRTMAKKRQSRKSYPLELKKRAVEMSSQEGVTVSEVAEQLGISAQQLSQWRAQLLSADNVKEVQTKLDALEENKKLREELKQLKMENDILKKAAAFFASQK